MMYTELFSNPMMILLIIWTLIWKGLALWRSARLNQKGWFIAILIINFFGVLEIAYLVYTQKQIDEQDRKNQEKLTEKE